MYAQPVIVDQQYNGYQGIQSGQMNGYSQQYPVQPGSYQYAAQSYTNGYAPTSTAPLPLPTSMVLPLPTSSSLPNSNSTPVPSLVLPLPTSTPVPSLILPPATSNQSMVLPSSNPGTNYGQYNGYSGYNNYDSQNPQSQPNQYTGPVAADYEKLSPRSHVYLRPSMWIGSTDFSQEEQWFYNPETRSMYRGTMSLPPALRGIWKEVLDNAADNVDRSRRAKVPPGEINITMDNFVISVTNGGLPIPIEIKPEYGMYVPELLFGHLMSGSNYKKTRHGAGMNGVGANCTNIFSTQFQVVIQDGIRGLSYSQTWTDNMKVCHPPVITPYAVGAASSVKVTYHADFARFGYDPAVGYPPEAKALFMRQASDVAFTSKVPVTFNNIRFNITDIREYAALYFGDGVNTGVVSYMWPLGVEVVNKKRGIQVAKQPWDVPIVEMIAIDTPDNAFSVSFVNSTMTKDGGVHVQAAVKAVCTKIMDDINDNIIKKLMKKSKGKEIDPKEKRSKTINMNDVKPHVSILISYNVDDPDLAGQMKSSLTGPVPKIIIDDLTLAGTNKWLLRERLYAALEAKDFANASKTDGKNSRHINCKGLDDANDVGPDTGRYCTLCVTEGLSAATCVKQIFTDKNHFGFFPMRGKTRNVTDLTYEEIDTNEEIKQLKRILGLRDFVDYKIKENFDTLRYGRLLICADADVDGKHIIGLIENVFNCRFKSLLELGYVCYLRTPTLRVIKGKIFHKFYTSNEYEKWKNETPDYKSWKHAYYKGLGSNSKEQSKDEVKAPRIVQSYYDPMADQTFRLCFNSKLADSRKDWISAYVPQPWVEDLSVQPISYFLNYELIQFSIDDNERSIPHFMDGLKESQQKILFGAHEHWKIGLLDKDYEEMKVEHFGSKVGYVSAYHHGPAILCTVIAGMAQDFPGSNNIPYFTRDGGFGTRDHLGKDRAQSRYPNTRPEPIIPYIFRREDQSLLEPVISEGNPVQPKTYYPIIPMVLVNGCKGMGTGWSTEIPNYNPIDIIAAVRAKLTGTQVPALVPWYRGFTGSIKMIGHSTESARNYDHLDPEAYDSDDDDANIDEIRELSCITYGSFSVSTDGSLITVTEIPIKMGIADYKDWLMDLREKKEIKDFSNNSTVDVPHFTIEGFKGEPTYRNLRLQRRIPLTNMTLLNEDLKPIKYDNVYAILDVFCEKRLIIYEKRRLHQINDMIKKIETTSYKIRFIKAVIAKEIILMKNRQSVSKTITEKGMVKLGIPTHLLKETKAIGFTLEKVKKLEAEIQKLETELYYIRSTPPKDIWLNELQQLEVVYHKLFDEKTLDQPVVLSTGKKRRKRVSRAANQVVKTKPTPKNPRGKKGVPTVSSVSQQFGNLNVGVGGGGSNSGFILPG